jgi:CDP-diacylglycerol--glycerol-3-phosphate 3-phosphatidyltransferase
MIKYIPISLILFRLTLAPIILGLVYFLKEDSRISVIILMYLGMLSDIFDGIIARRINIQTQTLRRLDSQTDMLFWLSIGISTWLLYPNLIRENKIPIITILAMEGMCYVISILKFKKETCTHSFSSKLFGITLLIAFTSLIGFNYAGFPFFLAITFGIISHIDRILITLILPKWTHDIPSFYHAYLIRKGVEIKRNKLFN